MKRTKLTLTSAFLAVALFTTTANAQAPSQAEILGPWDLKVNAMGREIPMSLVIRENDGELGATVETPQGAQDAESVKYDNGDLTFTIKFGPQALELKVKVEGQTFAGNVTTPFGEIGLAGLKVSEEAIAEQLKQFDRIIGDWSVTSTYNGKTIDNDIRFKISNNELVGSMDIDGGMGVELGRIALSGDTLSWLVALPFISDDPGRAVVTLDQDGKFAGAIKSELGEITITGEMIDTRKLVLSPYDDPARILGAWNVDTTINGEAGKATVVFLVEEDRLHAKVQTDAGELVSNNVDFKIVSDTMSVIRVHLALPDYGTEPLTFEVIVDGDSFEGEEVTNSELEFLITGKKAQ